MKENIKAILFDFDGVLADTMEDNFLAWKKAFKNYQKDIKKEDYFPLEGMKLLGVAKTISEKYNLNNVNFQEIVALKNKFYLEDHKFSFYGGVIDLVNLLKSQNLKLAIVSASPKEKLEKTVPKEFLEKFDIVVSGDDCENGKPHPEPYLKAINELNLSPENCVIIENAPLGIKSAKNAGVYCIALTNTLEKEYLREADLIFTNYEDLTKYFLKK